MEQTENTCKSCGAAITSNARFCRDCGAPLFEESELGGAQTINYGRQYAPPPRSAPLPPSIADALAADTETFAKPAKTTTSKLPPVAPAPARSRMWLWIAALVLCTLFGAMIGSLATESNGSSPTAPSPEDLVEQQQEELKERGEELRRQVEDQIRQALQQADQSQDRVREAQDRVREAQDRIREAMERAHEAAADLPPEAKLAGEQKVEKSHYLDQYKYPGATIDTSIRLSGSEILKMRTKDSYDALKQFYQKLFGEPLIEVRPEDRLIFKSASVPTVMISVEPDPQYVGQLQIHIVRTR